MVVKRPRQIEINSQEVLVNKSTDPKCFAYTTLVSYIKHFLMTKGQL